MFGQQAFVYLFGDEENSRRNRDNENKKKWCEENGVVLKRIEEMRKIKKQIERHLREDHQIEFDDNAHLKKSGNEVFTELDAIDQYYIIKVKIVFKTIPFLALFN